MSSETSLSILYFHCENVSSGVSTKAAPHFLYNGVYASVNALIDRIVFDIEQNHGKINIENYRSSILECQRNIDALLGYENERFGGSGMQKTGTLTRILPWLEAIVGIGDVLGRRLPEVFGQDEKQVEGVIVELKRRKLLPFDELKM
jgi:hypothetical protein